MIDLKKKVLTCLSQPCLDIVTDCFFREYITNNIHAI